MSQTKEKFPTIEEMRAICQKPVINSPGEMWYGLVFGRKVSIYFTYLFVRFTPITANGVTVFFIILGALGNIGLATGKPLYMIIGSILLHLWIILDCTDGEVARFKKTSSAAGVYLDALSHYLINPGILWGLGFGIYSMTGNVIYLYLSIIAYLAMMYNRLCKEIAIVVEEEIKSGSSSRYKMDIQEVKPVQQENVPTGFLGFIKKIHIMDHGVIITWITLASVLYALFVEAQLIIKGLFFFYLLAFSASTLNLYLKKVKYLQAIMKQSEK